LPSDRIPAIKSSELSLWPLAFGVLAILVIIGAVLRFAFKAPQPQPVQIEQNEHMLQDFDALDVPEA
jgi:hypothetical protein